MTRLTPFTTETSPYFFQTFFKVTWAIYSLDPASRDSCAILPCVPKAKTRRREPGAVERDRESVVRIRKRGGRTKRVHYSTISAVSEDGGKFCCCKRAELVENQQVIN